MTPRAIEDLLAASVARRMAGRTLLDEDYGTVLEVDATNHIARVTISDVELWVPFGKGAPTVGRVYPVRRTLEGARWLVVGGVAACRTWTFDADFNEGGAAFEGDMLDPATRRRLELPVFGPFGDGADGPAVHDLDGGDVDLGVDSICGRATPDAAWAAVTYWERATLIDQPAWAIGPAPAGVAIGDEVLIYIAQVKATGGDADTAFVGAWFTHRVAGMVAGLVIYTDRLEARPAFYDRLIIYLQRIPNYTTIGQTGGLNTSAITCGYHDAASAGTGGTPPAGAGTGVVFVRASVQSTARYTAIAKGYEGGANGEHCEDLGVNGYWEHSNPGHGKRVPNGSGGDGGTGKFGGGSSGGNGHCLTGPLNAAHRATYGHDADAPSVGGGGGHATAGQSPSTGPSDATRHARAPFGMHYAGRPDGAGGIAIGQAQLMYPAAFYGSAFFGGGGGSAGDYFLVHNNPGGPGGTGGGFVAVFAKIFHTNGGSGFTIPTIDVNGSAGQFLAGGGAAGSIIAYAEEMGSSLGLDPWFMAERVDVAGANQGWSGLGGGLIGNADVATATPGQGAVGRVQVHYETTLNGYTANGSVNQTSGALTYAGCWTSAPLSGAFLGLEAGEPLTGTAFTSHWTLDSDGEPPVFTVEASADAGFGSPTTYTFTPGGAVDIDSGVPVDLSALPVAAAPYWRVGVCLDSGADLTDTPTVEDLELCLEGG